MKVNRSKEGTLIELLCALLVIIMWVVAIVLYRQAPEFISTHFDATGHVDGTGSRLVLLLTAAIGTVATALLLVSAYHPDKMINMPMKITSDLQYAKMVLMVRVLAVEIAALFIFMIFLMGGKAITFGGVVALTAVILLTTVYFVAKVYRLRQ